MDEAETILLQLHCGHWFHDDCIRRWAETTGTRPASRYPLRCHIPSTDHDSDRADDRPDHGFDMLANDDEPNTSFA